MVARLIFNLSKSFQAGKVYTIRYAHIYDNFRQMVKIKTDNRREK